MSAVNCSVTSHYCPCFVPPIRRSIVFFNLGFDCCWYIVHVWRVNRKWIRVPEWVNKKRVKSEPGWKVPASLLHSRLTSMTLHGVPEAPDPARGRATLHFWSQNLILSLFVAAHRPQHVINPYVVLPPRVRTYRWNHKEVTSSNKCTHFLVFFNTISSLSISFSSLPRLYNLFLYFILRLSPCLSFLAYYFVALLSSFLL